MSYDSVNVKLSKWLTRKDSNLYRGSQSPQYYHYTTGHYTSFYVVRATGLEPARVLPHKSLNLTCLPIPSRSRTFVFISILSQPTSGRVIQKYITIPTLAFALPCCYRRILVWILRSRHDCGCTILLLQTWQVLRTSYSHHQDIQN